ncbi:MAG: ribonuclease HII [Candidatus Moeniiplasma glomeromycotorum]|nr:ribonuclease HII [Candidatus Moeniiplasma glomeromycotorum]MCE8167314.1 ribonuclease HII [Candidatus Moeniiplasma glomeromycotorum]MCE8168672.1 ribonuclease HII [Candidatus Moeniiplasma glomeromycotorum]
MVKKKLDLELEFRSKYPLIAGVDEAGRGALAGPIVVAAVILPPHFQSLLIQDSKILEPSQREEAYQLIKQAALEYNTVFKGPRQIEEKNPLRATQEAMVEAILKLKNLPDLCLIDGKEEITAGTIKTLSIIGGDRKSINIAAASIIAKVTRDHYMQKIHSQYTLYNWFKNKGYPDSTHLQAIFRYGVCSLHRKNYEPIKSLLQPNCDPQKVREKYHKLLAGIANCHKNSKT